MNGTMASYGVGILALVSILVLWVVVQAAWGRVFAGYCTDPDVLAGRRGCGGCKAKKQCHRRPPGPGKLEEGTS